MPHYNLALLGFGNVGRAFARLLMQKRGELYDNYNLTCAVTGIYTARHGAAINPAGLDLQQALAAVARGSGLPTSLESLSSQPTPSDAFDFIQRCEGDVLFETSPVNYETGQPATTHLHTALERGIHGITANKGPVVHAYRELTDLAESKGLKFYFEATVMDGAPIFSLFRETLPAARLLGIIGILNSTTNLILSRMEQGETLEDAIAYAQSIGIAETDPSGDVDGWDAAVKVAALVTVLMGVPLKPDQVERQGIRNLGKEQILQAREEGKRWKLVCAAHRQAGKVETRVSPQMVPATSPLYSVDGATSIVQFETDVLGLFSIIETDPGPHTTAYGLLADFLNVVKGEAG